MYQVLVSGLLKLLPSKFVKNSGPSLPKHPTGRSVGGDFADGSHSEDSHTRETVNVVVNPPGEKDTVTLTVSSPYKLSLDTSYMAWALFPLSTIHCGLSPVLY